MGKKNYVAKLQKHARRSGSDVRYETVSSQGEGCSKRFFVKAVINGQPFPTGEGINLQKAKQNAARSALRSLNEKENQRPVTEHVAKSPTESLCQKSVTTPSYVSLPSDVLVTALEASSLKTNNATLIVVGNKEYPADSWTAMIDAKDGAAKLQVHQEICVTKTSQVSFCSAVSEDGTEARLSTVLTRQEFHDGKSKSATSDSVVFISSSNHSKIQDIETPETMDTENSSSEVTLTQSEGLSKTSEFVFLNLIGKGGFGYVFKAKHKLLEKNYAIKIVPCTDKEKTLREAKALLDLEHRNIVRCNSCWLGPKEHEWDSSDDSGSSSPATRSSCAEYLYIQMTLYDPKTLKVWIDEINAQSVTKTRRQEGLIYAQQIVSGVEYIHSKNFIHRDLKPANIMFGENNELKIGDFGLVTVENDHNDENLMERTVNKGTPSYMAPEQKSKRNYDRKVDIFAFGLIYFELLWKFFTVLEKQKVWTDVRRQKFPEGFCFDFLEEHRIIKSMLSAKPEDRPEASQLVVNLDECKLILSCKDTVHRDCKTV
ncbi:hypothetical protein Q5P01_021269 [Channa striata]|uniref:non-specific serine/threonine protein kinase n=1 Tax=Channa striata TaxID=64152 RepID=A0AA88S946_CHASR|nr:hypothetical protein Q5P01_021269 [Channa striata]